MYKLVVVDLDGTMLNSYGEITENTKNTIKKSIDKSLELNCTIESMECK